MEQPRGSAVRAEGRLAPMLRPPTPAAFADGVLLNRRNRRLIEKASACAYRATKVPLRVMAGLNARILERIGATHDVTILPTGSCRPGFRSALGLVFEAPARRARVAA
jgi:hypothetical protein